MTLDASGRELLERLLDGEVQRDSQEVVERMKSDPAFERAVRDHGQLETLARDHEDLRQELASQAAEEPPQESDRELIRRALASPGPTAARRPGLTLLRRPVPWLIAIAAALVLGVWLGGLGSDGGDPDSSPSPLSNDGSVVPRGEVTSFRSFSIPGDAAARLNIEIYSGTNPTEPVLRKTLRFASEWTLSDAELEQLGSRIRWTYRLEFGDGTIEHGEAEAWLESE